MDLRLYKGEVLGLVGESGSGKSTMGSILTALQRPDSGQVLFRNRDIFTRTPRELRKIRKELQLIFQQSGNVLDPRMTTGAILTEALSLHNICSREEQPHELKRLLELVGLHEDTLQRYPGELSGGMLQRVIIARAVSTRPSVIICDEPVSALDVSVQGQVLNLLKDLQEELELSYIFISHDIDVIRHMADRVAVLESGELREGKI
ncbi:ATP-binding cassette domain-containing protein [Salinispira pacifica]|uniref:Oligopeptide transport ATP-binding protein OppF n=1 Tax=Salinispira pacifica TaxID=1307761 RepID=V5WKJ9_9SPIO|nr:dipeptide/oligopeptide/nickel ABC transporter ATP-binding protein [Salinispira pacifica]AHC16278.1 Oligopeptide transport ATP-binding protein OppF [Salinispira pacifica]